MIKRCVYALSTGGILVSIIYLFYDSGGWRFARPGDYLNLILSSAVTLAAPDRESLYLLPEWVSVVINVIIYSGVTMAFLYLVSQVGTSSSDEKA